MSSPIDTAYRSISLLMVKPRTTDELIRLTECSRYAMNRHLKAMHDHGLVRGEKRIGEPVVYGWVK